VKWAHALQAHNQQCFRAGYTNQNLKFAIWAPCMYQGFKTTEEVRAVICSKFDAGMGFLRILNYS